MRAHILLSAAFAAAVTVGCADSQPVPFEPSALRISPEITRVTGVNFDAGDRIGLSVRTAAGTYFDNRPMTYDGTVFSADGTIWYNDLNQRSVLAAYYPYSEAGVPAEFSVATDQNGDGFAASDLLAAVRTEVVPTASPVEMVFRHLMTKLSIRVDNKSDAQITSVSVAGFLPSADVDIEGLQATATGTDQGTVLARTVTAETLYEAIVVPQTASLTVSIATDDGKSHSKKCTSQDLLPGRVYSVDVVFTNIDIEISVSGQITDWTDGGKLTPEEESEGGSGNSLLYGGATYGTVTLKDGRTWMATNLRYLPEGSTASADPVQDAGIWYPCSVSGAVSTEESFIAEQGLLYGLDAALGCVVTVDNCAQAEGAQGLCPDGWHIPTSAEFGALIDAYGASVAELEEMGFLTLVGIRTVAGSNAVYNAMAPDGVFTKGYLTGSTASDGFADGKFIHLCIDRTSGTSVLSLCPRTSVNGMPLRCVKNRRN